MIPFLRGVSCVFRGIPLLRLPGVRRHVIAPLLINLLMLVALVWYGLDRFAELIAWIETLLPAWLSWLDWLLWPLFTLVALLAGFLICLLLASLVAAPFTGPLAAAVETHLRGRAPATGGGARAFVAETAAALAGEARKFGYFALRAAPLGLLALIPGVNLIAAPLWLLFSAWMLALEYTEVPLGNHGLNFPAVRAYLRQRRMSALGLGTTLLVLTLIPLVNLLVIPIAVAGATVMVCEERETLR